jgi:hypothetical protein
MTAVMIAHHSNQLPGYACCLKFGTRVHAHCTAEAEDDDPEAKLIVLVSFAQDNFAKRVAMLRGRNIADRTAAAVAMASDRALTARSNHSAPLTSRSTHSALHSHHAPLKITQSRIAHMCLQGQSWTVCVRPLPQCASGLTYAQLRSSMHSRSQVTSRRILTAGANHGLGGFDSGTRALMNTLSPSSVRHLTLKPLKLAGFSTLTIFPSPHPGAIDCAFRYTALLFSLRQCALHQGLRSHGAHHMCWSPIGMAIRSTSASSLPLRQY